ncbi:MAG: T9SS type A sorting domain-containing protein [FCB group bacterium]|nr:T9SS type A sorting domain-containing protein [FCB group bacterium]
MSLTVDFTGFTFAGLPFTGTGVEYGDDASWLLIGLTSADKASIEAVDDTLKDEIIVDIQPDAFVNADSVGINLPLTTFMDGVELTAGTESVIPLVGIGRNFWLISKEAFPTLDRELPATIRKVGDHCVIYVADDQWTPYNTVDVHGTVDSTNHNYVPIVASEIEAVYEYFESVDSAYFKVNDIFAVGKEYQIPETVNIFVCDIRDEYNLGRNDSNDGYWIGSFFNPNDQSTVWEAGDEYNTNDLDMIYLDSWPQLYSDADTSHYWNTTPAVDVWDFNTASGAGGGMDVTVFNAITNAYTKLLCYKVDPWESEWMVEGFASFAEFVIEDNVSFYGAGNPTTPTANSIRNFSNGLKSRIDFFNSYMFILYLYEKYGGIELIETLSIQPAVDMAAVDVTFEKMLQNTVNDTGAAIAALRELWQTHTVRDAFSHYGVACLLDTTNMAFAAADPDVEPDNYMFQFDNVNLYGVVSGKNAAILKWDPVKGPPPYYMNQENWSFNYYYTTFNPLAGLLNPMICETRAAADTIAMADTTIINVILPVSELNFFQLCLKNEAVATLNDPDFYYNYMPYDGSGGVSFPLSPSDDWTFYHYAEDGSGGLVGEGEYKTMVTVGVLGGSGKITHAAIPPAMYQVSIAQNPLAPSRFDIYLLVSDLVWGDLGSGDDVPELTYSLGESSNTLPMAPFEFTEPFGYTGEYSFYSSLLNLDGQGTYQISVFFTDLSGEEYTLGPFGFAVDSFNPGSPAVVSIDGAACLVDGDGYDDTFTLHMSKIDQNAGDVEEEEFLYSSILFQAPPADKTPIGPSYNIGPEIVLNEPAWISLPYADYIDASSPAELGIYLFRNGNWDYLGGTPNPADQTIKVRAKQLGLMQIQAGPHPLVPADLAVPVEYALKQNYPNPFNPVTNISYQLPLAGNTLLKVYDVTGREVRTLVDGFQNTGSYRVSWDGRTSNGTLVSSGVYFYTLKSGKFKRTSKMILLK